MVSAGSAVDVQDFKQAMSRFASGVNVVTVHDPRGHPYGMTLNAFCSVSLEPPLVLLCVNRGTRTHRQIMDAGRFGVSVLNNQAAHISRYCAQPLADKQLPPDWLAEVAGSRTPVLRDALVHTDCSVYATQPAGTHMIVVGKVEQVTFGGDEEPLLYYRGGYRRLDQDPTTRPTTHQPTPAQGGCR